MNSNSRNTSKNKVRNQIVDEAQKLFERYGYKKTTIDDISTALKKAKSAVYYYFKSKEDIYKAVLEKEARKLQDEVIIATNNATSPEDKIRAYIEARFIQLKRLCNLNNYLKNNFLTESELNALRNKYDTFEVEIIQEILKQGLKSGIFKIRNPYLTSVLLLTIIKGLEVPVLAETPEFIQERIDELLPILFHGISA